MTVKFGNTVFRLKKCHRQPCPADLHLTPAGEGENSFTALISNLFVAGRGDEVQNAANDEQDA